MYACNVDTDLEISKHPLLKISNSCLTHIDEHTDRFACVQQHPPALPTPFPPQVPKVSLHCVTAVGQLGQQINPFTYHSYLIVVRSISSSQDCYGFFINLCQTNCFGITCSYNEPLSKSLAWTLL